MKTALMCYKFKPCSCCGHRWTNFAHSFCESVRTRYGKSTILCWLTNWPSSTVAACASPPTRYISSSLSRSYLPVSIQLQRIGAVVLNLLLAVFIILNRRITRMCYFFSEPDIHWSRFFVIIIIYHDFLPTPRRGSHFKSGKTHTHTVIKIHPLAHILDSWVLMFSSCALFTVYPNRIM